MFNTVYIPLTAAIVLWGAVALARGSLLMIHETHEMARTPIDTLECRHCWNCTCHGGSSLEQPCPEDRPHQKRIIDGEIEVCSTCTNSDGYMVAWELTEHQREDI